MLRRSASALLALSVLAVVAISMLSIDWSSFTDALSGVVPDILLLAAALVSGVLVVAVVFKGGKTLIKWAEAHIK